MVAANISLSLNPTMMTSLLSAILARAITIGRQGKTNDQTRISTIQTL
jgi:hypothetical protein